MEITLVALVLLVELINTYLLSTIVNRPQVKADLEALENLGKQDLAKVEAEVSKVKVEVSPKIAQVEDAVEQKVEEIKKEI